MLIAATLACLFGLQDLTVTPVVGTVGEPFVVAVARGGAAVGALRVEVVLPSGAGADAGVTGPDGQLVYVPREPGAYAFAAEVDGVRCLATFRAAPARRTWMLAFGSVPVGLALLWLHLRSWRRREG